MHIAGRDVAGASLACPGGEGNDSTGRPHHLYKSTTNRLEIDAPDPAGDVSYTVSLLIFLYSNSLYMLHGLCAERAGSVDHK